MRDKKGSPVALLVWRVCPVMVSTVKTCFKKMENIRPFFSCQMQLCCLACHGLPDDSPIGFLQVLQAVHRGPSDAERIPARCTDSGWATSWPGNFQRFGGSSKAEYGDGSKMIQTYHDPFLPCWGMVHLQHQLFWSRMNHRFSGDFE